MQKKEQKKTQAYTKYFFLVLFNDKEIFYKCVCIDMVFHILASPDIDDGSTLFLN